MGNRYLRLKRNKYSLSFSWAIAFVVVLFLSSAMLFKSYTVNKKVETCNKKIEHLNEQISAEKDRAEEIAEYGKYTKTKKFAEEEAKEKLGLVNENEIIFKTEN